MNSSRRIRTCAAFAGASVLIAISSYAGPSSRPGWGAIPYTDSGTGTTFRVWAPNATSVAVKGTWNGFSNTANPLFKEGTSGVWSVDAPGALVGYQYKYRINGTMDKQDPRGRNQQSSVGNSIIYNTTNFNWAGDSFSYLPQNDTVIYELNIGSFNDTNPNDGNPGTFASATSRLSFLKDLGVSAVEVMPINEFPGNFSWGYNPSDIFGVESSFGGPDGFKSFVKACHQAGLGVILDVVHNHYGPTDLDLWQFDGSFVSQGGTNYGGIYFYQQAGYCCTPYGNTRPNYSSQQVRNFIQDTFSMWLNEYHMDGFRWDSPGYMMNSSAGFITDAQTLIQQCSTMIHTGYFGKVNIGEDQSWLSGTSGFDSTWANVFYDNVLPQLTTSDDNARNMGSISYAVNLNHQSGQPGGWGSVLFTENHDKCGDLNGAQRTTVYIDGGNPTSYFARKRSTLGAALVLTTAGMPMILQGQEMLTTNQFGASNALDWSRTNTYSGIVALYRDLIHLRRNLDGMSSGLKGWNCQNLPGQPDNSNKVIAYRRYDTGTVGDDVVVIANFANATRSNYGLTFPKSGTWYTHFNSDSTNYSSDFGNVGTTNLTTVGNIGTFTIGPYSVLILSQIASPVPVASFLASPTNGLAPLTVTFTNLSTGIITNQFWTFGDSGTSTAVNPSHTYTTVGTFSVALTVFGTGGTNTLTQANLITVPSVASATWTNANASGNWSAATSWNPASVPDAGADVTFGTGGGTSVVDGVSRTVGNIAFNRAGNFTVMASGGAGLTINTGISVGSSFSYTIAAPSVLGGGNLWSVGNGGSLSVSGPVSGGGAITKTGAGALTLFGTNNYSGATVVSNGTLAVSGDGVITNTTSIEIATNATLDVSGHTGAGMTVANGQTLAGNGMIQGNLILADGSSLSPGDDLVGTLAFLSSLALSNAATLQYDLGTVSDLAVVGGNLTLGGTLNINDSGGFAAGVYTLLTYGGALTYNGVTIGTTPNPSFAYTIDTNTPGQVKLRVSLASTISVVAADLQDRFGSLMPTSGVAVLVVDTGTNGFVDPQPTFLLNLGATWGADDQVLGLWDLGNSFSFWGQPGGLADQTIISYTGGVAPGQRLELYWFPSLTLASNTVGVTYYGKYTDTNNPPLDGSAPWTVPNVSTNIGLSFFTQSEGGSNPNTAGQATLLTAAGVPAFVSWQMQYFGCTNCPQAQADADPLGKGISNTNQFLVGLNPTNPASLFRIVSAVPQSSNVVVTWTTAGAHTNAVQATAGNANGGYGTNFIDISSPIIVQGSGDVTTNYLDAGAVTNVPSRYYRVRLVP
jgi:1,4-alpha-glucan branching enzyme